MKGVMAKKREREISGAPIAGAEEGPLDPLWEAGKVGLIGGGEEESGTQRTPLTLFNLLHWLSPTQN